MSRYSLGRIEKDWTMVGLKTFWILISTLFLLAACVPQTKQTECGANEAFNASLRTCVPVVGGPSSFINISSFVPQFTQSRQKDDSTTLTFTIAVSNPYSQSYSVEWERVFNAAPVTMCSNALSCSFSASLLGTVLGEVGTHILTAKVKDGNGAVVDSHAFEIKVNDFPKPVINTSTLVPSSYAFNALPSDARIPFSFTIRNNNATLTASDNYRTIWTIVKNGAVLYTESDSFTSFSLTGTNSTYLGVSPTSAFNPATLGVGSYIVRAVVQNDIPGEIVAEQQWNVIIQEPDLANVTTIAQPAPGVTITAHNGVAHNDFPALSWIYSGTTQPNFCVTVDDRDGTYAGDGQSIQVRWYLDGLGGEICTKETLDTPGTQTICLVDANNCDPDGANIPFDTSLLVFANSNAVSPQTHKVTARLFDERTSAEFQRSDVVPSNGSYPIEWLVNNKPINTPPVMGFGTINPTGCTSAGAYTRSNCQVNQGTNFTVSFTASDDFYSPVSGTGNPEEFQWDLKIKHNGADIISPDVTKNTTCSKAFGTDVTVPAASGPYASRWTCTLAVPHYISGGPLDPLSGTYQVIATMQDQGSPVGGAGLISPSLTWNLVVTETNSGISISPQTALLADSHIAKGATVLDPGNIASFATELETVTFRLNITDPEVDNFKYQISLCTVNTPTPCTASTVITSPALIDYMRAIQVDPDQNPVLVSGLLYQLPEDLLLQVSPQLDVNTTTSSLVYFKMEAVDAPSVPLTAAVTDTEIFQIYVRNHNPAPSINTATASPALASTTVVYSGVPFSIDPGSASDASGVASESNILYQWYADNGGGWTAITGATSRILKYTPGNTVTSISLKVCVGDRPAANPVSSAGTCFGNWTVTPKRYLETLSANGMIVGDETEDELAVWFDDTNTTPNTQVIYSAYVKNNATKDIYVEKTIKNAAGNIVLSTQTVVFSALNGSDASDVQNLSIAGDANSIYIAYLASSNPAPTTMVPRIRRIEKSEALTGTKTALDHPDRFGFNYTQYVISETAANCTFANGDGIGGPANITCNLGTGIIAAGESITVNGVAFTGVQICGSPACATGTDSATNLANLINASTLPALQGITATANAEIVELHGQYASDFIDFPLVSLENGLGKIVVTANRWHLPFINSSLAGAQQNNITVLSGATDIGSPVHLSDTANLGLSTNDVLTEMGKTVLFDAKLNVAGELVFARVSGDVSDAGAISIFRYTLSSPDWAIFDTTGGLATDRNEMSIFGLNAFEYVKLATNAAGNPHYYVIAKENTLSGGDYYIGRFNPDLDSAAAALEYLISAKITTTDSTDDVISNTLMINPEIVSVPGFAEARIFFHSVGTGVIPYPRMARWKSDDSVTCGTCFSLSGTLPYKPTAKIGISQLANNVALGASGSVPNEHVRDLVFALFSTLDGNGDHRAQLGIINVEAESIHATAVDATGLFQPPFAK